MAERIHGFGVLTFAHTLGYLCKSSWQSARPHYLSANRGHAERQGKTLKLRSRGEEWTLSVQRFYADWSSKSSCGLQWSPKPPDLVPLTTFPPLMDTAGQDAFGRFFMEILKRKSPRRPPLRVFHKAGWPLPRRRRYRHPETEEHSKLHILTVFEI